MKVSVNVYVTNLGMIHELPDDLVARAKEINAGKRITDRRTKGDRLLRKWAEAKDSEWVGGAQSK